MALGNQNVSRGLGEQMTQMALNMGGTAPVSDGLGDLWYNLAQAAGSFSPPSGRDIAFAPTTAVAETIPRNSIAITTAVISSGSTGASGTLILSAIYLPANTVVNNFNILIGTASSGVTHQWFCLCNSARVVVAVTADNTGTDLTANTVYTQALTAAYTVPTAGLYYVGFNIAAATTVPTAYGYTGNATANGLAPRLFGASSVTQTTPPAIGGSAQTAITAQATEPYIYLT